MTNPSATLFPTVVTWPSHTGDPVSPTSGATYPAEALYPSETTWPSDTGTTVLPTSGGTYPSESLYPTELTWPSDTGVVVGPTSASRIKWNAPSDKRAETGIDRGVFYPKTGPAVAWNGLTGVDENGADSVVAYYLDGRPYLYMPQAKEFQATLKAYTYPDAFAACMGLVEATDGMYLDSQMGDSFDLSYRTLVIDGVKGVDAGYKIHLIYNAVATPQGVSYETISSDMNVNDLSWDIQAVPVPVEGYRATAHIIIDTSHMDPEHISTIETLLYGNDVTEASIPRPQIIFDLLTFGSGITVTDNGDDTWTVEGSYRNVLLTGDGTFEIDNINANDHGDGTYDITSTP